MFENKRTVPRHASGAVVIRFDHLDASGIIHQVDFVGSNVHPDSQGISSGNQCQTWDIALEYLWSHSLTVGSIRFEAAMGCEYVLAERVCVVYDYMEVLCGCRLWRLKS